jgi:hypothetical protein
MGTCQTCSEMAFDWSSSQGPSRGNWTFPEIKVIVVDVASYAGNLLFGGELSTYMICPVLHIAARWYAAIPAAFQPGMKHALAGELL